MLQFRDNSTSGMLHVEKEKPIKHIVEQKYELWKMYFDGSSSKEGARASIVLISPGGEIISLMHKLEFVATNNTTEYEALILGLRAAKDLCIQQIYFYGDSKFIRENLR